jgi:hypothetical protein
MEMWEGGSRQVFRYRRGVRWAFTGKYFARGEESAWVLTLSEAAQIPTSKWGFDETHAFQTVGAIRAT